MGNLADFRVRPSDVERRSDRVRGTYVWINKGGGIGGAKVNVDNRRYAYQGAARDRPYNNGPLPTRSPAIRLGQPRTRSAAGFRPDSIPYNFRPSLCRGGSPIDRRRPSQTRAL